MKKIKVVKQPTTAEIKKEIKESREKFKQKFGKPN